VLEFWFKCKRDCKLCIVKTSMAMNGVKIFPLLASYYRPKDVSPWTYEHEHMNKIESFLEYFVYVNRILKKYSLTCRTKHLLTCKNILSHVHGWMIFMDEKMDEIYFKCWQQMLFLRKIEKKKQSWNNFCWFLSKKFDKWNVQVTI
jgi:hypothetical protein